MSDLIDRWETVGALWDMTTEDCPNPGAAVGKCMEVIKAIPSADRLQGEWIPCEERLPSEEEQDDELGVLVTLGHGYKGLQFDWYHDGRWYDWGRCVIAWMPLPEPWKGADDE